MHPLNFPELTEPVFSFLHGITPEQVDGIIGVMTNILIMLGIGIAVFAALMFGLIAREELQKTRATAIIIPPNPPLPRDPAIDQLKADLKRQLHEDWLTEPTPRQSADSPASAR
jgi:hypothetical protein